MRRGEDDHHPRRSEHADQHGRHPALGLEQRLAPRRTQGQVPVVRAAAQHHRLPEVSNETNAPVCCCYESYDGKRSTYMSVCHNLLHIHLNAFTLWNVWKLYKSILTFPKKWLEQISRWVSRRAVSSLNRPGFEMQGWLLDLLLVRAAFVCLLFILMILYKPRRIITVT